MKDYNFANKLTELRKARGYSQESLGRLMGVSDKAVSKWENGNSKPRASACAKLASLLGVDVDQLMDSDFLTQDEADMILENQRKALWEKAEKRMEELYGEDPPLRIMNHFITERNALHRCNAVIIFDVLARVNHAARQSRKGFYAGGSTCFTSWLLGATEVNPLEAHVYCPRCHRVEFYPEFSSGWDIPEKACECGARMIPDGHSIPVETCVIAGESSFSFFMCDVDLDFIKEAEDIILTYGEQFFGMQIFREEGSTDYERSPEGEIVKDPKTRKPIPVTWLPLSSIMFTPKKKAKVRKPDKISGPSELMNWGKRIGQPTIVLLGGFYGPHYLSKPTPFKSTPDELVKQDVMERALKDYWNYKRTLDMTANMKLPDLTNYIGKLTFETFITFICSANNVYMTSGPEELADKAGFKDFVDMPLSVEELWKVIIQNNANIGYMSGIALDILWKASHGMYLCNDYQQLIGTRERKLFQEMNLPDWFASFASNMIRLCYRCNCIELGIRLLEDARRKIRDRR